MSKWGLFLGCKDGLISSNRLLWYITLTKRRIKIVIVPIDVEKAFDSLVFPKCPQTQHKWQLALAFTAASPEAPSLAQKEAGFSPHGNSRLAVLSPAQAAARLSPHWSPSPKAPQLSYLMGSLG